MAEVAEPNLETEPFRLGTERTTKHMMPFKPSLGVAYKALATVLLKNAIHSLAPPCLHLCELVGSFRLDAKFLRLAYHTVNEDAHFPCVKLA